MMRVPPIAGRPTTQATSALGSPRPGPSGVRRPGRRQGEISSPPVSVVVVSVNIVRHGAEEADMATYRLPASGGA